jgi:hypothetical protein
LETDLGRSDDETQLTRNRIELLRQNERRIAQSQSSAGDKGETYAGDMAGE